MPWKRGSGERSADPRCSSWFSHWLLQQNATYSCWFCHSQRLLWFFGHHILIIFPLVHFNSQVLLLKVLVKCLCLTNVHFQWFPPSATGRSCRGSSVAQKKNKNKRPTLSFSPLPFYPHAQASSLIGPPPSCEVASRCWFNRKLLKRRGCVRVACS